MTPMTISRAREANWRKVNARDLRRWVCEFHTQPRMERGLQVWRNIAGRPVAIASKRWGMWIEPKSWCRMEIKDIGICMPWGPGHWQVGFAYRVSHSFGYDDANWRNGHMIVDSPDKEGVLRQALHFTAEFDHQVIVWNDWWNY